MKKLIYTLFILLITSSVLNADEGTYTVSTSYDGNISSILITGNTPLEYKSSELVKPSRLVIGIHSTGLIEHPSNFAIFAPVKRISIQPDHSEEFDSKIVIEYDHKSKYNITSAGNTLRIDFYNVDGQDQANTDDINEPLWLNKKINLSLTEGSVAAALNLISRKADINIVIAEILENPVWINLTDVTVKDALSAIVLSSGNTYFTSGDVLVVTKRSDDNDKNLITRVYDLKYISAATFVSSIEGSLSSSAKIKVISETASNAQQSDESSQLLLLTDYEENHEIIADLISQIDIAPEQIAISVKFIESNISKEKNIGIDWSNTLEAKISGADPASSEQSYSSSSALSAFSQLPLQDNDFMYGTLTVSEATSILRLLSQDGNSRLLSDPSVTSSDGKTASISVTTTIPIQTINRFSEGAIVQDVVTYEYKEVGITLDVTPRINENGRITLKCLPSVEEITGWVGPENNQQPITTKRSIETEVVVVDGETLVIGGLYKESTIENISKLWLLGDIPFLGNLFKSRQKTKEDTDLLIFITPVIIR